MTHAALINRGRLIVPIRFGECVGDLEQIVRSMGTPGDLSVETRASAVCKSAPTSLRVILVGEHTERGEKDKQEKSRNELRRMSDRAGHSCFYIVEFDCCHYRLRNRGQLFFLLLSYLPRAGV